MFKHASTIAFALAAGTAYAGQCDAVMTSSGTVFNLTGLQNKDQKSYVQIISTDGTETQTFEFNYCDTVEFEDGGSGYGASHKVVQTETTFVENYKIVAEDKIDKSTNLRNEDNDTIGIVFEQGSDNICQRKTTKGTEDVMYSMKTQVTCSEGDEDVVVESVALDGCVWNVNLKHSSGCPTVNLDLD